MRVVSWNVNGIRACVRHGFVDVVDRSGADIVGIQEVRATRRILASRWNAFRRWLRAACGWRDCCGLPAGHLAGAM